MTLVQDFSIFFIFHLVNVNGCLNTLICIGSDCMYLNVNRCINILETVFSNSSS